MKKIILLLLLPALVYGGELHPEIDKKYTENSQEIFNRRPKEGLYRNDMALDSEGNLFICPQYGFTIYKLDSQGSPVLKFGKKGGNPGEFLYSPKIHGIWEDEIYTSDSQGRVNIFTASGTLKELVKVDYSVTAMFPMKDQYIILGFVVTSYGTKDVVVLKDRNTGKERIIHEKKSYAKDDKEVKIDIPRVEIPDDTFRNIILARLTEEEQDELKTVYKYNKDKDHWRIVKSSETMTWQRYWQLLGKAEYRPGTYSWTSPFSDYRSFITPATADSFIFGNSQEGSLIHFSLEGKVLKNIPTKISPLPVTEEDKNSFYINTVSKLEKAGFDAKEAAVIKEPGFFNDTLPYYYKMMSGADNSTLLFLYTQGEPKNRFRMYSLKENEVKEYTLHLSEGSLNISPLLNNIVFNGEWMYAISTTYRDGVPYNSLIKGKLSY